MTDPIEGELTSQTERDNLETAVRRIEESFRPYRIEGKRRLDGIEMELRLQGKEVEHMRKDVDRLIETDRHREKAIDDLIYLSEANADSLKDLGHLLEEVHDTQKKYRPAAETAESARQFKLKYMKWMAWYIGPGLLLIIVLDFLGATKEEAVAILKKVLAIF